MNLADAEKIANAFADTLRPSCERIEIAGSIRRRRPTVNDVDIVCIPRYTLLAGALFDRGDNTTSELDRVLHQLESDGRIQLINDGPKLKRGTFPRKEDFPFDIYIADASTWAMIYLVRTGPAAHNQMLCQLAIELGGRFHADGAGITDKTGKLTPADSEAKVFELLGLPYQEPEQREGTP